MLVYIGGCAHCCLAAQLRDAGLLWDCFPLSWSVPLAVGCRRFCPLCILFFTIVSCSPCCLYPLFIMPHCSETAHSFNRLHSESQGKPWPLLLEWCAWSPLFGMHHQSSPSVHIPHVTITVLSCDHLCPLRPWKIAFPSRGRSQLLASPHRE